MKKVIISGYYGFDNIGDDAMVETFCKYFKQKGIDLIVMSKNPEKTSRQFDVESIDRFNIFQIISSIKSADVLISGGGTLLQDVTRVISIWYYLFVIIIGLIFKKPVYLLFQGFGPINNKFNLWLTKKVISKVHGIALRDNKAYEEMKSLGLNMDKAFVATDLVFALDVLSKEESVELLKKYIPNYSKNKKYIGVSLRPWKDVYNEEVFGKLLGRIKKQLNVEIVFFPFHRKQDYLFSKDIQNIMGESSYIIYDDLKPSQVAGIMSLMNANIGVRLHSLIFATMVKVPVVGITYDPKVDGFLQEMGLSPVCEYSNIQEDKIINKLEEILNDKYDKEYFKKIDENKENVIKVLDKVIGDQDINGKG